MTAASPLQALRLERNLTRAELARRLGVSSRTVRAMETGGYAPSVTLACRVARELGRPVETLFHA